MMIASPYMDPIWYGTIPYHTTTPYIQRTPSLLWTDFLIRVMGSSRQLPYLPDYFHDLSPPLKNLYSHAKRTFVHTYYFGIVWCPRFPPQPPLFTTTPATKSTELLSLYVQITLTHYRAQHALKSALNGITTLSRWSFGYARFRTACLYLGR